MYITWIMGVETIIWQTRATYDCRLKSMNTGLVCGLDCTPALPVMQSATVAAVCGLWRYISAMPLPFNRSILFCCSYNVCTAHDTLLIGEYERSDIQNDS